MITDHQKNIRIPKWVITILNQIYEIERKTQKKECYEKIRRNLDKIKDVFTYDLSPDNEIFYEDPYGQPYSDSRVDLEANIAGTEHTENLYVIDVIKPIIRIKTKQHTSKVIQKGIVTVQAKSPSQDKDNEQHD